MNIIKRANNRKHKPINILLDKLTGQACGTWRALNYEHKFMHLSMSSPRGGEGLDIGWGFWHFLKEIIKIPTPGQRIMVKIGRNKWFTSHLLFKIDRSNTWCQVKIPTLGICITVKFPWVARPPPLGLDIDRYIRCTFKKWRPYTPGLFVEFECVRNLASKDIIHYRTITLMTTITMDPDGWKREEGGLFKGVEEDHCEIKLVRDCWCVFKWNMNMVWI